MFDKIVAGAWRNGEPGMIFFDQVNTDNHVIDTYGEMIATNPCGEQPLLANESCNLGSINLANFFVAYDGTFNANAGARWSAQINWERLQTVTKLATRFLDNVIDANRYATPEIEEMTKATRKIGLGVMGFADLLIQLKVGYHTKAAREIGRTLMEHIKLWADEESIALGVRRGPFPAWENSTYNKITEAYRNHCRLTVAPTGTISMISDTSSGIEPTFALVWKKQNILDGKTLNYVNRYFEADARKHGFYSEELMDYLAAGNSLAEVKDIPEWVKDIYITAPEIHPDAHVLMQAAFQVSVDSGISKTINFDNSATLEDVENAYMLAWVEKCKGITVYRAGSRDKEVMVKGSGTVISVEGREKASVVLEFTENEACCASPLIVMESGCECCKSCGWSACLIA